MIAVTRVVGLALIAVGVLGWLIAGGPGTSLTALLPAALGLVVLVLGLLAGREALHRHMIHAALAVAVLGVLGTVPTAMPLLVGDAGDPPVAEWSSLVTALVCLVYVGLGVRSFVAARRAREGASA